MSLNRKEIDERMIELRNLRKLHTTARERVVALESENKALKARIQELEEKNKEKDRVIADLQYQLEELKTIVFGKQRRANDTLTDDTEDDDPDDTPPAPRPPESYRRPIPKDSEVTKVVHHRFPRKPNGDLRLRTYYVEDIPLDIQKTVEQHVVEQYYDTARRIWVSQDPLPSAPVVLGDNVRVLVATLITVERLSYAQVQGLLVSLFGIQVSSGEITNILTREATLLTPAKDSLLTSIQSESSHHLDESRYDVRGEAHYAWSITGGQSHNSVYLVGQSRGKGSAETLRGDSDGVLVSDDYAAYRYLATHHQLCWAHLIRHFRDLAAHPDFTPTQIHAITTSYQEIKAIYRDTKVACSGLGPGGHHTSLTKRLTVVAEIHPTDPKPVIRHKTTLAKNIAKYFTCLSFPTIGLTNNAAERSLRHVVLKRKVSFGAQSHQGATTMSILFSVLLTLRRQDPTTYYQRYLELRRV